MGAINSPMNLLAPSIACRATSERRCVDVCQDWLAVNVDNKTSPLDGQVLIYTRFRPDQTPPMRRILQQTGAAACAMAYIAFDKKTAALILVKRVFAR